MALGEGKKGSGKPKWPSEKQASLPVSNEGKEDQTDRRVKCLERGNKLRL